MYTGDIKATAPDEAYQAVLHALGQTRKSTRNDIESRGAIILDDVILLARLARSKCLITYADAIAIRGHGNAQTGKWLDDAFSYGIRPLGFPDLTMLVVNKATRKPSPEAFNNRRSALSKIHVDDVGTEQKRCIWYTRYEDVLGVLDPIPTDYQLCRILTDQPEIEREFSRCVDNAINRALREGKETLRVGKAYPQTVSRAELMSIVQHLWTAQCGRCALTGKPFETSPNGIQEDRVSLDRINNGLGYAQGNVQLVTQFANRARGTLPIEDARIRLAQYR